jgi:hypothetical protein
MSMENEFKEQLLKAIIVLEKIEELGVNIS